MLFACITNSKIKVAHRQDRKKGKKEKGCTERREKCG